MRADAGRAAQGARRAARARARHALVNTVSAHAKNASSANHFAIVARGKARVM
jgi:hypothetical protein